MYIFNGNPLGCPTTISIDEKIPSRCWSQVKAVSAKWSKPWKNLGDVHCQIVLSFFSLASFKSWRVGTGNASNPSYAHTSKPVVARASTHIYVHTALCRKVGLIISKSFKNFTLASLWYYTLLPKYRARANETANFKKECSIFQLGYLLQLL